MNQNGQMVEQFFIDAMKACEPKSFIDFYKIDVLGVMPKPDSLIGKNINNTADGNPASNQHYTVQDTPGPCADACGIVYLDANKFKGFIPEADIEGLKSPQKCLDINDNLASSFLETLN